MPESKILPAPSLPATQSQNDDGSGSGAFRREQISRLGSALVLGPYMVYSSRTVREPWFRRGLAVIGLATIGYNAYLYLRDIDRAGAFGLGNLGQSGAAQRNLVRARQSLEQSRVLLERVKGGEIPDNQLVTQMRQSGMSDDAIRQRLIQYLEQSIAGLERNMSTTEAVAEREAEKQTAEESLPEAEPDRPIADLQNELEAAINDRWLPDTSALRQIVDQADAHPEAMRAQLETWVRKAHVNKQRGERVPAPEPAADESDETVAPAKDDEPARHVPVKDEPEPEPEPDFHHGTDIPDYGALRDELGEKIDAAIASERSAAELAEHCNTLLEDYAPSAFAADDEAFQWHENARERCQAEVNDRYTAEAEAAAEAERAEMLEELEAREAELSGEYADELDALEDEMNAELEQLAAEGATAEELAERQAELADELQAREEQLEAELAAARSELQQARTAPSSPSPRAPRGGNGNGNGNGAPDVQTAGVAGGAGWMLPAALAAGAAVLLSRQSQQ